MSKIDDGGPAYPVKSGMLFYVPEGSEKQTADAIADFNRSVVAAYEGMSLRDWFAGQALAGICAHRNASNGVQDTSKNWNDALAKAAYHAADAMIAARKTGGENV